MEDHLHVLLFGAVFYLETAALGVLILNSLNRGMGIRNEVFGVKNNTNCSGLDILLRQLCLPRPGKDQESSANVELQWYPADNFA